MELNRTKFCFLRVFLQKLGWLWIRKWIVLCLLMEINMETSEWELNLIS